MGIKHLNLTVTDVTAAREFLEKYFGLICSGTRGNGFAVMRDNDGFILTLMKGKEVQYPRTFHVGFPQESEEQVDKINERLKEDGFWSSLLSMSMRIRFTLKHLVDLQ